MATTEITVKQVQNILQKEGLIVNEEQVKLVLDFLRLIAGIVVENYLKGGSTKSSNL